MIVFLTSPYDRSRFPVELIEVVRQKISQSFGIRQPVRLVLTPPVHHPYDPPWYNHPLQTVPGDRRVSSSEIGTLILRGPVQGRVNINFFVSRDKTKLEVFLIVVSSNETPGYQPEADETTVLEHDYLNPKCNNKGYPTSLDT